MSSGILGGADLTATTDTTIYTVPDDRVATLTVSLCNRNSTVVLVRIALVGDITNYIEYDFSLGPNLPIERSGIALGAGQSVLVRSDTANISASVYGWEEAE